MASVFNSCLALLLPALAAVQDERPVNVFFKNREVPPLTRDQLRTRQKELDGKWEGASKVYKELENELKAKHGKKKKEWPEDARRTLQAAEDAAGSWRAELRYLDGDPRLADTVQDMKNTVAGKGTAGRKERIRDVASERDAHLVIEVMGRRRDSAVGTLRGGFCVAYVATLGPKVNTKRKGGPDWSKPAFPAFTFHSWSAGEPFWKAESCGINRWGTAAYEAVQALDRFIKGNQDALLGPPSAR